MPKRRAHAPTSLSSARTLALWILVGVLVACGGGSVVDESANN